MYKAISDSKLKKIKYFDMGGLNYTENMSVAKFKKDFGGEEVKLIGMCLL